MELVRSIDLITGERSTWISFPHLCYQTQAYWSWLTCLDSADIFSAQFQESTHLLSKIDLAEVWWKSCWIISPADRFGFICWNNCNCIFLVVIWPVSLFHLGNPVSVELVSQNLSGLGVFCHCSGTNSVCVSLFPRSTAWFYTFSPLKLFLNDRPQQSRIHNNIFDVLFPISTVTSSLGRCVCWVIREKHEQLSGYRGHLRATEGAHDGGISAPSKLAFIGV